MMSFSLNAFMPYEGYRIAFNGTKGGCDARVPRAALERGRDGGHSHHPLFKASRTQTVGQGGGGGHWGADNKLHKSDFSADPCSDPLHQKVTVREAALECC